MHPVPNYISTVDVITGKDVMKILPAYSDIPQVYKNLYSGNQWLRVVEDWMFRGIKNVKWVPKPGVDGEQAVRAVTLCLGSFEPSYEHKVAGCAYLLDQWFEDVTYTPGEFK